MILARKVVYNGFGLDVCSFGRVWYGLSRRVLCYLTLGVKEAGAAHAVTPIPHYFVLSFDPFLYVQ